MQPIRLVHSVFATLPYFKEGRGWRTESTFRNPHDFGINKGLANLPYLQKIGRHINRRLLEVERVSHNSGRSGDSIQRVVQPAVTADGKKAPGLKFGQPRVRALLLPLTLFQHLIDGFRNRDLRKQVADLLGVTLSDYTPNHMTYDLRRLRLKGLSTVHQEPIATLLLPTAEKLPGCSHDWRRGFSDRRCRCSPATTPFCRSPFAEPSIASTRNLTC